MKRHDTRDLRPLSDSEIAWSAVNPGAWCNLCRSVTLAGEATLTDLERMLPALTSIATELGCCLTRESGKLRLAPSQEAIELRSVEVGGPISLERVIEDELARPVGTLGTPLIRITLLLRRKPARVRETTLLLTCHHVLIDRNAVLNLLTALADGLAGRPLTASPYPARGDGPHDKPPGWVRYLLKQAKLRLSPSARIAPRHCHPRPGDTQIVVKRLSAEATAALVSGSRAAGVTITGLLVATAAKSYARLANTKAPLRYSVASDLTRGHRLAGMGSEVGLLQEVLKGTTERATLDLARQVANAIKAARARAEDKHSARLFALTAPLLGRLAARRHVRLGALTVTNLMHLDLPPPDLPFGVTETLGVVTNTSIGYDVAVHANTVAGRLVVSLTTSLLTEPAFRGFADDLESHLLNAVGYQGEVHPSAPPRDAPMAGKRAGRIVSILPDPAPQHRRKNINIPCRLGHADASNRH